jgi:hypothetical protein
MWEIHSRLEAFSDKVTGLESNFDNVIDCRYLGVGGAALASVLERARKAQEVRNTLVLFGLPEHDVAVACYAKDQINNIHDCVGEVLLRGGGSWSDIVSQEVVNSSTLNWLKGLIEKLNIRSGLAHHASNAGTTSALDRYRIRRLKESYPIINFMILRYENDDEELIFGWGHHSEDPGGRVFMTRNTRLIATFDSFWHMLEKDSIPFKPDIRRPIASADITGLWYRVAYDADPNWEPSAGMPPKPSSVNVALVSIGIANRNIAVKGVIVEQGGIQRTFESVAADLEGSQLWFATERSVTLVVAGWYRFIHTITSAVGNDSQVELPTAPAGSGPHTMPPAAGNNSQSAVIEEFYGQFFDPVEAKDDETCKSNKHYRNRKLVLFGRRVTKDWPPHPGTGVERDPKSLPDDTRVERDPESLPDDPQVQADIMIRCQQWWDEKGKQRWKGPLMTS